MTPEAELRYYRIGDSKMSSCYFDIVSFLPELFFLPLDTLDPPPLLLLVFLPEFLEYALVMDDLALGFVGC